jgi:hypothetical protein
MVYDIALESLLLFRFTRRNLIDVALVAVAFPLRKKVGKRKPVIWTGTSRPTSAWLMLLSELRPAAGMSMKGFVYAPEFLAMSTRC